MSEELHVLISEGICSLPENYSRELQREIERYGVSSSELDSPDGSCDPNFDRASMGGFLVQEILVEMGRGNQNVLHISLMQEKGPERGARREAKPLDFAPPFYIAVELILFLAKNAQLSSKLSVQLAKSIEKANCYNQVNQIFGLIDECKKVSPIAVSILQLALEKAKGYDPDPFVIKLKNLVDHRLCV